MAIPIIPGVDERLAAIEPVLKDLHCELDQLKSSCEHVTGETPTDVINTAMSQLAQKDDNHLSKKDVERIELANQVAEMVHNDKDMILIADRDPGISTVEELALRYNAETIAEALPEEGDAALERATRISQMLYEAKPGAAVAGLINNGGISIPDATIRHEVASALVSTDVLTASMIQTNSESSTEEVKFAENPEVDQEIRKLRRVNTIASSPASVTALVKMKLTSAAAVASLSPEGFIKSAAVVNLPAAEAQEVHTAAVNTVMKHTNLLLSTVDIGRDNSPILDGRSTAPAKRNDMRRIAARLGLNQVNFDKLFGGNDETLTEEWGTVYSPAAYFVDLLQYLKTGIAKLDGKMATDGSTSTALDYLLRKRPDLALMDLTRENAETPLPYVDVVNEIMESFIVHFDSFILDEVNDPKKLDIDSFNVNRQTASDLLWRPQNTKIEAYAYLASSIFPLSLPYHQPIDTARAYLQFLSIDRTELMDKFRSKPPENKILDAEEMRLLHKEKLDRAYDAESLGLVEDEYVLLTKEGFQSPEYLKKVHNLDENQIRLQYNVRPVHEHYGYRTKADMEAIDGTGLEVVKGQFLRRTGISWIDLVAITQTKFINPNRPEGKDLAVIDTFKSSYRYLQTLVIPGTVSGDPFKHVRSLLLRDSDGRRPVDISQDDIINWVKAKFSKLGGLIVLESNDGPYLHLHKHQTSAETFRLVVRWKPGIAVPKPGDPVFPEGVMIRSDGILVDRDHVPIGNIDDKGRMLAFGSNEGGTPILARYKLQTFEIHSIIPDQNPRFQMLADVNDDSVVIVQGPEWEKSWQPVTYIPSSSNGGTSDLETVTLRHLNGTPLTIEEWDRLQLFIRLWRKLGWSVEEVDMGLDAVTQRIDTITTGDSINSQDPSISKARISPRAIRQIVIVKTIATMMDLPLEKTLTIWTDIPTAGKNSLYSRIFLRGNTPGTASVFEPDSNGRVLASPTPESLLQNALGVMANLDIGLADLNALLSRGIVTGELTLKNMSIIYRCRMLARFIGVGIPELVDLLRIFNNPLETPERTLSFLKIWLSLQDGGFNVEEVDFITSKESEESSRKTPLSIDEIKIALTCKELRDQIEVQAIKELLDKGTSEEAAATYKTWLDAVDELVRQPQLFFNSNLAGIFPDSSPLLKQTSLASSKTDATLVEKYTHFINISVPQLISRLSQAAVVSSIAAVTNTSDLNLASTLLELIKAPSSTGDGESETALAKLTRVGTQISTVNKKKMWRGYLLVPQMDDYVFYFAGKVEPEGFHINDKRYELQLGEGTSQGTFHTDPKKPIRLNSYQLYHVILYGASIDDLQWQCPGSSRQSIPDTCILPDVTSYDLGTLFDQFNRACIVANRFNLTAEDVLYIDSHSSAFSGVDFNNLETGHLQSIRDFVTFRESLPDSAIMPLRNLFNWCEASSKSIQEASSVGGSTGGSTPIPNPQTGSNLSVDPALLPKKLSDATGWDEDWIDLLLKEASFYNGDPGIFVTEKHLVQMGEMLEFAKKADVDVPTLFRWARPIDREIISPDTEDASPGEPRQTQNAFEKQFSEYHRIALTIRMAAQSKTSQDAYQAALRPVNDELREHQRDAMIQYLINQDHLLEHNIQDADSLFEFFLIDVQTSAMVETSRLRQAISTVQLFVQRCFLGLEREYVGPSSLDRNLWDWMKSYAVWAANRKVFLYPENWIEPSLRDTKTPLFKELETEISQNELTKDTVTSVVRGYMSRLAGISNLEPVGFYIDDGGLNNLNFQFIHFFSRTKTTPFDHYHRIYDNHREEWTPWTKMGIEIPTYVTTDGRTGSYLIPTKLENRLVVFIPQIIRMTEEPRPVETISIPSATDGTTTLPVPMPLHYYEIRMSWTEQLSGGTWTPRQLSADRIKTDPTTQNLPNIETFHFLTLLPYNERYGPASEVTIAALMDSEYLGYYYSNASTNDKSMFHFHSGQLSTVEASPGIWPILDAYHLKMPFFPVVQKGFFSSRLNDTQYVTTQGHYNVGDSTISWLNGMKVDPKIYLSVIGGSKVELTIPDKTIAFSHPDANSIVNASLSSNSTSIAGIQGLYDYLSTTDSDELYGGYSGSRSELGKPYSLYTWEMGLHIPMLLVDRFLQAQQFEDALAVLRLVFDPVAPDDPSPTAVDENMSEAEKRKLRNARFWRFRPFKEIQTMTLEGYLLETIGSKPGQEVKAVTDWRHSPFQPHLVARSRPMSYMKWIVTKYIEVLIAYGDFYLRQNTLDSIPNAVQMYVLASHLCGPRGQKIPRRDVKTMNYQSLSQNLDAFSNAIVQLEEQHPFSNQVSIPRGKSPGSSGEAGTKEDGLPTMFGFATAFYFSIPDNPKIREQRDLIDDRLFKIRHSQDINGITRKLPLFDPPLDPGLLVRAKAQGLSLSSVLSSINGPMPNYRFQYLLTRAMDMAVEIKALGNGLLSIKERHDGEAAAALRAKHETNVFSIGLELKKHAVRESEASLEATEQSREAPAYRLKFYLDTLGIKAKVPAVEEDFNKETFRMEEPLTEGGLKLLSYEKLEMDKYAQAQSQQQDVGKMEILASVFHSLPLVASHATPLGCGVAINFGPPNIASAMQATGAALKLGADALTYQASSSGRKGASLRATYDRYLQLNQAGLELKTVDKQILAARIRLESAKRDLANYEKQIAQAVEYEDYLRSKFTNVELYAWMSSSVRSLHYDTYNHAYDLASKAVKAFKYERPRDVHDYLQPSYWDASREGLLSGEKLHYALKQLESAYQNERGYDYEITKHVSLRQLDPLALMQLREGRKCSFTIPEAVFDLDFPGHYLRRIKTVSISMPCVVGPYTSVSAVLRLTGHKYRINPGVSGGSSGYNENRSGAGEDPRFATSRVPVSSIATSSAMDDVGQFELNFRDERYLPFEGAGAISSWTLELPGVQPQFDYNSISDVVLHVRYTSVDGGGSLKDAATKSLSSALDSASTGHVLIDLRNEYAGSWTTIAGDTDIEGDRVMTLPRMETAVPFYLRGLKLVANTVNILSDVQLPGASLTGDPNNKPASNPRGEVPSMEVKKLKGPVNSVPAIVGMSKEGVPLGGTWSITFPQGETVEANRVWMLIKYSVVKR